MKHVTIDHHTSRCCLCIAQFELSVPSEYDWVGGQVPCSMWASLGQPKEFIFIYEHVESGWVLLLYAYLVLVDKTAVRCRRLACSVLIRY